MAEDLKPMPILRIVPNMGWDTGLNLEICHPSITVKEMDVKQWQMARFKYKPRWTP